MSYTDREFRELKYENQRLEEEKRNRLFEGFAIGFTFAILLWWIVNTVL